MTQALDIEAVLERTKRMAEEANGVHPNGWIVAREAERELRESRDETTLWVDKCVAKDIELREARARIAWLEQKIASVI